MKIFYGVQATGNGHISRARSMAPLLKAAGIEVDYLFSGRKAEHFFDMEPFGDFQLRQGLTFQTANGKVQLGKTIAQANLRQIWSDIKTLDLSGYDLVITDFEPISAWAAKRQGVHSIAIGHQYAFDHKIPKVGDSFVSRLFMKHFTPADTRIGLHWHHFNQLIMPPIIDEAELEDHSNAQDVLVYLPFENANLVLSELLKIPHFQFHLFSNDLPAGQQANVVIHKLGRNEFQNCLNQCQSVLCNAGFELASEALKKGRRIMVKPTYGQMEQLSNAQAMSDLQLGWVIEAINQKDIETWLNYAPIRQIHYPNTAQALVQWMQNYQHQSLDDLIKDIWQHVHCRDKKTDFQFS